MASIVLSAEYHCAPRESSTHYHDCHQILYIARGSAVIRVNGQLWQAGPGSLAVFSRCEHHRITDCSADYRRYILDIAPQISGYGEHCHRIFSLLFHRPDGFRNVLDMGQDGPDVESLLARMVEEKQSGSLLGEEMLALLLQQLLIRVCRRFPELFHSSADPAFQTVCRLQSRFEKDLTAPFCLSQLARELDMSVSSLSHQFKRVTGTSVMGYLTACRVAAAKKHLTGTDMSIGQIVEACGFSDASNFSRLFRQQVGCSPSQFRQAYFHDSATRDGGSTAPSP